jgi:hypothetical protein
VKTIEKTAVPETKTHDCWEEDVFWAVDGLLSKICPGILIFTILYLVAHIINRAIDRL